MTDSSRSFQDTFVIETGLSGCHKLVVTVVKLYFPKQIHNTQNFRDYKIFQNNLLKTNLDYELSKLDICKLGLEFMTIELKGALAGLRHFLAT